MFDLIATYQWTVKQRIASCATYDTLLEKIDDMFRYCLPLSWADSDRLDEWPTRETVLAARKAARDSIAAERAAWDAIPADQRTALQPPGHGS